MPLAKQTIRKSNALVEASYRLSVFEQRIILSCISRLKKDEKITDDVMYRVSATEIADASGIPYATAYKHLEEAAARLFERRVTLYEAPNGQGKIQVTHTRWVQTCKYVKTAGYVEVRFGKDVLPYLTELSVQFTKYYYSDVAKMSSAHAIRLYEILMQWRKAGFREVEIEWLRGVLQLDSKYPSIKDLKRWVIEPAVEQINRHSPLNVTWDQRKTGRRVSHFLFTFTSKHTKLPKTEAKEKPKNSWYGIPIKILEQRIQPGESYEDCALRLLEENSKLNTQT